MAPTRRGPLSGFDKGLSAAPQSGFSEEAVGRPEYAPINAQVDDVNRKLDSLMDTAWQALERLHGHSRPSETQANPPTDGVFGALQVTHRSLARANDLVQELASAI